MNLISKLPQWFSLRAFSDKLVRRFKPMPPAYISLKPDIVTTNKSRTDRKITLNSKPIKFTVRYKKPPNQLLGMSFIINGSSCRVKNISLDLDEGPTYETEEDG